jgi:hypothetical protein
MITKIAVSGYPVSKASISLKLGYLAVALKGHDGALDPMIAACSDQQCRPQAMPRSL